MRKVWITALTHDEAPTQTLMRTVATYGLAVDGHFWSDDLKNMAWASAAEPLEHKESVLWIITGPAASFGSESIRYGLSMLALMAQARRGLGFPVVIIPSDGNVDVAGMPTPLRSAEDCRALAEGLVDGVIDAVATDHAPHDGADGEQGRQRASPLEANPVALPEEGHRPGCHADEDAIGRQQQVAAAVNLSSHRGFESAAALHREVTRHRPHEAGLAADGAVTLCAGLVPHLQREVIVDIGPAELLGHGAPIDHRLGLRIGGAEIRRKHPALEGFLPDRPPRIVRPEGSMRAIVRRNESRTQAVVSVSAT